MIVCLRVDGEAHDVNIVIKTGASNASAWWRVGPQGGSVRGDSWSVANTICLVTSNGTFPDAIQAVFERAINTDRRGWVELTVRNGQAISARPVPST